MHVNAKFFCNHCGNMFDDEDFDDKLLRCPVCDGYKISLQLDMWNEPDPQGYSEENS